MKLQFTDGSLFNMTRYSEDSHIHAEADKVAILEFELRRATQTINSLRTELTQQVTLIIQFLHTSNRINISFPF